MRVIHLLIAVAFHCGYADSRVLKIVLGDGSIQSYDTVSRKISPYFSLKGQGELSSAALRKFELLESRYDYRTAVLHSIVENEAVGGVLTHDLRNKSIPGKFFPGIVRVFLYAESAPEFPVLFMRANRFVSGDNLMNFNFDRFKFERLTRAGLLEDVTAWTNVGEVTLSPMDNCFDPIATVWQTRFTVEEFDTDKDASAKARADGSSSKSTIVGSAPGLLSAIVGCWDASTKLFQRLMTKPSASNNGVTLYRKKLSSNQVSELTQQSIGRSDVCVAADAAGRYAFCYGSVNAGFLSLRVYDFDKLKVSELIELKTENVERGAIYVIGQSKDRQRWYFVYGHPLGLGIGLSGSSIYQLQLGDNPALTAIELLGLNKIRGVFEAD